MKTSTAQPSTTLRNWNVDESCSTKRCCTLSLRETLKASSTAPATTIMRNRNADDLLGNPLLKRRVGYDHRHFHQLSCSPRSTTRAALWDPVQRDLRHGDNLLVKRRRVDLLEEIQHQVRHQRHRHIEDLHEGTDLGVLQGVPLNPELRPRLKQCRRPPLPLRACHHQRRGRSTRQDPHWLCARRPTFIPSPPPQLW